MITKENLLSKYDSWLEINKSDVDKRYKLASKQLNNFLMWFGTKEKIDDMTFLDYVFQTSGNKNSLCYLLDYGTDELGMIRVDSQSGYQRYCIQLTENGDCFPFCINKKSGYGDSKEEVFNNIKQATIALFVATLNNEKEVIDSIKLPQLYKNKLHYLLTRGKSIPIYVQPHLNIILRELGIVSNPGESAFTKRCKLFDYLIQLDRKDITPWHFMNFIYSEKAFDLKHKKKPLEISLTYYSGNITKTKIDLNAINSGKENEDVSATEIGKAGERYVYDYLISHRKELHIKRGTKVIDLTDNKECGIHCDFKYIKRENGIDETIYIEVKATSNDNPDTFSFQMSCYEHEFMLKEKNHYFLFYVNNVYKPNGIVVLTYDQIEAMITPLKYFSK